MKLAIQGGIAASFKKIAMSNMATPWIVEYYSRMRLAKLGYTEDLSNLDDHRAKIFLEIAHAIDREDERDSKRRSRKK